MARAVSTARLELAFLVLATLLILDGVFTYYGVRYVPEANPVMIWCITHFGLAGAMIVTRALALVAAFGIYLARGFLPLVGLSGFYFCVSFVPWMGVMLRC